jgi:hypothetical protein
MPQECSRGTCAYPQKEAADWEVSGAMADIAMAPWGTDSTKTAERGCATHWNWCRITLKGRTSLPKCARKPRVTRKPSHCLSVG